jgi:hypothetical protein
VRIDVTASANVTDLAIREAVLVIRFSYVFCGWLVG